MAHPRHVLAALLCMTGVLGCNNTPPNTIIDGQARFQLLSPTLIRMEFADDRHFDDGISFNRSNAPLKPVRFTTRVRDNWREIETDKMIVRWLRSSGAFDGSGLTVQILGDQTAAIRPFGGGNSGRPIGAWIRALDAQGDWVQMHPTFLDRDGWCLLSDSNTAMTTANGWVEPRPAHIGYYSDHYLFAYGHDYAGALADLDRFAGPPPMLPRWAFGVWYSRYWPYSAADYHDDVLPHFRKDDVPLDVLVVDTDWKAPNAGNGWSWNTKLFPDGKGFLRWANGEGLHVTLNIHPSIASNDPLFAGTNQAAGGTLPRIADGLYSWDWGDPKQAASYFALHDQFDKDGVRFWWFDWCCEDAFVHVPGADPKSELVPPDSWVSQLYAERAEKRGLRGFAFARIGGKYIGHGGVNSASPTGPWPDHRTTIHFTGDTFPTWNMLSFQVAFTIAEGAAGFPYVTHDIGSFFGKHLPEDLYVRWVQFGAFQPIFRLHSHHGDRLPWDYSDATRAIAEKFMQLRESLVPYLYTLGHEAHESGMPLVRGLYFAYPNEPPSYTYRNEYLLGDALLVMPITSADGKSNVWFPPGGWTNIFTGEQVSGPRETTVTAALDTMPVFARTGAIVPRQPPMRHVGDRPVDPLLLDVYAGADGKLELYEDEGEGLGYRDGKLRRTPMQYVEAKHALTIAAGNGSYSGAPAQRAYEIAFVGVPAPSQVTVDGAALDAARWRYDEQRRTVHAQVPAHSVSGSLVVQLR